MTALEKYNEFSEDLLGETPLERLRFFCSFAMNDRDWLDVEPFLEALRATPAVPAEPAAEVMDMWLCESDKVVLRIGQLYRFKPDLTCKSCMKLKAEHDEAYGLAAAPEPAADSLGSGDSVHSGG